MKIETILSQIDLGSMALPEFQRGYVWNRDQVRGLMDSLYRRHPVGSLLVWVTQVDSAPTRGDGPAVAGGFVDLLLDGQQRMTTLYGVIRGKPPRFFDGDPRTFQNLFFNMEEESFEFYAPLKMKGNPLWVDVTDLMQQGVGSYIQKVITVPELQPSIQKYINRLTNLEGIKQIEVHIEKITGEDKTIDVVVDVFNRVNSGGTKLSKGDLALARLSAQWPDARDEMRARIQKWRRAGYKFELDWQLRCVNAAVTGEAKFTALSQVDTQTFRSGLERTEKHIDAILNLIASRLGLDHDDVLGSPYSFPLLVRYLDQRGGKFAGYRDQERLLYWYIHTFIWGRYAGSTESVLNVDLDLIENPDGAVDRLIDQLRQQRGDLRIQPGDFVGWSRNTRFYPLLYMLTRVEKARDWESGIELNRQLLGKQSILQLHHIFPKALLYKYGYSKSEVNALANFTFLSQETNIRISDRHPNEYLPEYLRLQPAAVQSHWIPDDSALWEIERYPEFLAKRRELLAEAANRLLDGLAQGVARDIDESQPVIAEYESPSRVFVVLPPDPDDDEESTVSEVTTWLEQQGLPQGERGFEIIDAESQQVTAALDLAWPLGLQQGLSQPVALLLNEPREVEEAANQAGFRFFTDAETFINYVRREVLAFESASV